MEEGRRHEAPESETNYLMSHILASSVIYSIYALVPLTPVFHGSNINEPKWMSTHTVDLQGSKCKLIREPKSSVVCNE